MNDYTPKNKAELHLTYKCNLSCVNCNRTSFLDNPLTEDMTLEDVKDFIRQCNELNWKPWFVIIGGEPTLHKDFQEIIRLSREYLGRDGTIQVWSNGYTQHSRDLLGLVNVTYLASIVEETFKPQGSQVLSQDDIFVSPKDFGMERDYCFYHGSQICGISVDHDGYMPCSIGGMIDGALELGLRTKNLSDLFNNSKAAAITKKMCEHCGHNLSHSLIDSKQNDWRKKVTSCKKKYGAYFSQTWHQTMEGKR